MWADGMPVSFTEAHAIAQWSAQHPHAPSKSSPAIPRMLFSNTFLPTDLAVLVAQAGDKTLHIPPSASSISSTVDFNITFTDPQDAQDMLIELTAWPLWGSGQQQQAVGALVGCSNSSGLFGGVTSTCLKAGWTD